MSGDHKNGEGERERESGISDLSFAAAAACGLPALPLHILFHACPIEIRDLQSALSTRRHGGFQPNVRSEEKFQVMVEMCDNSQVHIRTSEKR